jgi:F-type H+-transporting ATP synthase subunit e
LGCFKVLRWSALAFGVIYGISHQRTITATQKAQHDKHEFNEMQKKIDQAKAEYAKQKAPPAAATSDGTWT